jgi:hypothetical protein
MRPTSVSPTVAVCRRSLDGWDTAVAGCKGLPQLATEKMWVGEVGTCTPVGVLDVAVPSHGSTVQPTYHFGGGMSASFAASS